MAGNTEFEFNERRFKDLLLYVAQQLADDPTFGETKLNKVLFFSDFEAYRLSGQPITGAEYQKNKHGPTARVYTVMRDELLRTDQATVERRLVADHVQDVVHPKVKPNLAQFNETEIELVNGVIREMRKYTNTEVSDLSHEHSAGWHMVEMFETIPYRTAIMATREIPQEDVARAAELAQERHWAAIQP